MRRKFMLFILVCISLYIHAQDNWNPYFHQEEIHRNYITCSAIFFNATPVVNEYSPLGKCRLSRIQKGIITLHEVELEEGSIKPKSRLEFQVAIRNDRTNTLRMYSNEIYTKIMLEEVLQDCERNDNIIIMTTDKEYSLSHHEIILDDGC